jgi:subfamily B ATP-binding cassette protein MsbA
MVLVGALISLYVQGGGVVMVGLGLALVTFVPCSRSAAASGAELGNQAKMGSLFARLSERSRRRRSSKVFGAEAHERARFAVVNDINTEGRKKTAELRARIQPLVEILGVIGVAIFVWVGGNKVISGDWQPEDLLAIVGLLVYAVAALRRLGDTNTKMHTGLSSADRVATVLYSEPRSWTSRARSRSPAAPGHPLPQRAYDHDLKHPVLRDISFGAARQDPGAGRAHSSGGPRGGPVPRLFDVDAGSVEIDGVDVRHITLASLRRQTRWSRRTRCFPRQVANNIATPSQPGARRRRARGAPPTRTTSSRA